MRADRQTDRQTDTLIAILRTDTGGELLIYIYQLINPFTQIIITTTSPNKNSFRYVEHVNKTQNCKDLNYYKQQLLAQILTRSENKNLMMVMMTMTR